LVADLPARLVAPDAVAALSVWALLIPQSLGYATLAGVPVQHGRYPAFVALIAYAIFGTSRKMAQGRGRGLGRRARADLGNRGLGTDQAVGWTAALALVAGVVYLLLGLLRMGGSRTSCWSTRAWR
jgi:MFS superfamily sulfate permease-like transporter